MLLARIINSSQFLKSTYQYITIVVYSSDTLYLGKKAVGYSGIFIMASRVPLEVLLLSIYE